MAQDGSLQGQHQRYVLPMMAVNLCTGTALQLLVQYVTDLDIADGRVQALAYAKYVVMLAATTLQQRRARTTMQANGKKTDVGSTAGPAPKLSKRAIRLMTVIGLLDLVSYLLHCVGFMYCGAATASVVFAASCQTFTALLTRLVLKRRLSRGQVAAVGLVLLGILTRGSGSGGGKAGDNGAPAGQNLGYIAILGAALGYACLGVVYDYMMRVESPPPSHSQVMDLGSRIGLAVSTVYQVGYTLPRYQQLVGSHLQRGGISPVAALAALAAFGVVIVTHTFVQGWVHRSEGAMAVGLVSAVSSATVAVGASLLFCGPAAPWQCLTPRKAGFPFNTTNSFRITAVIRCFRKPAAPWQCLTTSKARILWVVGMRGKARQGHPAQHCSVASPPLD